MNNKSLISQPIFLVGAERSGTTVLRLMLDHHPTISWCNEFEYVVDQVSEQGDFPSVDKYQEWLETHRIFQATGFKINSDLNYVDLVNSFLQQKLNYSQKTIIGATVHRHFNKLLKIWPDARFIHLVRDGRDVARSCIGMGWAGNVWTGVERWIQAEILWEELCYIIPKERRIEVKYEDLILDPLINLQKICEFIGVSYHPAMLEYPEKTSYTLPDAKLIFQWRKKLSDFDISLVEARGSKILEKHGYQLSGLPSIQITPMIERKLYLQDWWTRVNFRIKRYGLPLFLADYLSRQLKLNKQQKKIKLKINEMTKADLK